MRKADNLPQSYAVVMKSGNLSFLEPAGPAQACNGTDVYPLDYTTSGRIQQAGLRRSVDVSHPNFRRNTTSHDEVLMTSLNPSGHMSEQNLRVFRITDKTKTLTIRSTVIISACVHTTTWHSI